MISPPAAFPLTFDVDPSERLFGLRAETADFDGDGYGDVLDTTGGQLTVHLQNSAAPGFFTTPAVRLEDPGHLVHELPLLDTRHALVGDFDGDGDADIYQSWPANTSHPPYDLIYSLEPDGAGVKWIVQSMPRRYAESLVYRDARPYAVADIDGNGLADILFINQEDEYRTLFFYPPSKMDSGWPSSAPVRIGVELCFVMPGGCTVARESASGGAPPRDSRSGREVRLGEPGVRLADLNGDGRSDLVLVDGPRVVYWPGDGGGGFGLRSDPEEESPDNDGAVEFTGNLPWPEAGEGLYVVDVTNDGHADLLAVQGGKLTVVRNASGSLLLEEGAVNVPGACGRDVRVLRGRDDSTTVLVRDCDTGRLYKVVISRSGRPGLLEGVDDGAVITSFDYEQKSTWDGTRTVNKFGRGPIKRPWVLTKQTSTNPIGLLGGGTFTTEYAYEKPELDADRRFVGFERVTTIQRAATREQDIITERRYNLNRCAGASSDSECDGEVESRGLNGKLTQRKITDGAGHIRELEVIRFEGSRRFLGTVTALGVAGTHRWVYSGREVPSGTSKQTLDDFIVDGQLFSSREIEVPLASERVHLVTEQRRGPFFEPRSETDYGDVDARDEAITRVGILQPTGGFAFRPVASYVDPGRRQETRIQYDAYARTSFVYKVVSGNVPLERFHDIEGLTVAPESPVAQKDGEFRAQEIRYDEYGNIWQLINSTDGSCTVNWYDPTGRFLAGTDQAAGLDAGNSDDPWCKAGVVVRSTSEFDPYLGLVTKVTAAGGDVARTEYDGFGRPLKVFGNDPDRPGVEEGEPSLTTTYFDPTPSRRYVAVKTVSRRGNGFAEHWTYADGFGRTIVQLDEADPGAGDSGAFVASGRTERDGLGRVVRAYGAAFVGFTPSETLPVTVAVGSAISMTRDSFGRVTETRGADGRVSSSVRYHPLSKDVYPGDDLSRGKAPSTSIFDGHGRLKESRGPTSDRGVSTTLVTRYSRLSTGEVTRVERNTLRGGSAPYVRWMVYNSLGQLVFNAEPNTSLFFVPEPPADLNEVRAWRYQYDSAGRLVGTSDARGCGKNLTYDGLGRLRMVDYSPCRDHHALYSRPPRDAAVTGAGLEAFYAYDELPRGIADLFGLDAASVRFPGKMVGSADRGEASVFFYDARGRLVERRTRLAKPGYASETLDDRYDEHVYVKKFEYASDDTLTIETTGAEARELLDMSGTSFVSYTRSKRGLVRSMGSSYGDLIEEATFDADGRPLKTTYGDAAHSTTTFSYNAREQLETLRTARMSVPGPAAAGDEPTKQLVLQDVEVSTYDGRGNPIVVKDKRDPAAWPAGAKPVSRSFVYDEQSRVTGVSYAYGDNDATWKSPYAAERAARGPVRGVGQPAFDHDEARRPEAEAIQYDARGNIRARDAKGSFFRQLTGVSAGYVGPDRLWSGYGPSTPSGSGTLHGRYDEAGNLKRLVVSYDRNNGQVFTFRWDEVGRLVRVARYDRASFFPDSDPDGAPAVIAEYAYDGENARVRKSVTDATGKSQHALYVFGTLEHRGAAYSPGRGYQVGRDTEVVLLGGLGRAFTRGEVDGHAHVFLTLRDQLGSASIVLDKETSEVVEQATYDALGATESDYRPSRWRAFREDYRFTGKEEDLEVGLMYFGYRYYSPYIGRWISPDPLTIHKLGADLNPYAYVGGKLSRSVDPDGLMEMEERSCSVEQMFNGACLGVDQYDSSQTGTTWGDKTLRERWAKYQKCVYQQQLIQYAIGQPTACEWSGPKPADAVQVAAVALWGDDFYPWDGKEPYLAWRGKMIHHVIALYYVRRNGTHIVFMNYTSVASIVKATGGRPNPAASFGGNPDIADMTAKALYEIKPEGSQDEGLTQAQRYIKEFDAHGVKMNLGKAGAEGTSGDVPTRAGMLHFESTNDGVIWYRVSRPREAVKSGAEAMAVFGMMALGVPLAVGAAAAAAAAAPAAVPAFAGALLAW